MIRHGRGESDAARIRGRLSHSIINALFSSDILHFDVRDMREVVPKAHDLVEQRPDR